MAVILIMTCRHQENRHLSLFFLLPLPALSVSRRLLLPVAIKVPRAPEPQGRPDAHQAQLQPHGLLFPGMACAPGWPRAPALGSGAPAASWWTRMAWGQCCGPPAWQVQSRRGKGTQRSPRRGHPGKSPSGARGAERGPSPQSRREDKLGLSSHAVFSAHHQIGALLGSRWP